VGKRDYSSVVGTRIEWGMKAVGHRPNKRNRTGGTGSSKFTAGKLPNTSPKQSIMDKIEGHAGQRRTKQENSNQTTAETELRQKNKKNTNSGDLAVLRVHGVRRGMIENMEKPKRGGCSSAHWSILCTKGQPGDSGNSEQVQQVNNDIGTRTKRNADDR